MLEEHDLELDRVLDRVAVILHDHRRFVGEFIHEPQIRSRAAVGSLERLAREAEAVRFAVVGGTQDHERSSRVRGAKRGVRVAIGLPAAERTHVRRRDPTRFTSPAASGVAPFRYSFNVARTVLRPLPDRPVPA